MNKGWIGVDLDGTLAEYHSGGKYDATVIGKPIPAMVNRVKAALRQGYNVTVLTARMVGYGGESKVAEAIRQWTLKHIGTALEATCIKDPGMIELWDDRAVGVESNTGKLLSRSRFGHVNRCPWCSELFLSESVLHFLCNVCRDEQTERAKRIAAELAESNEKAKRERLLDTTKYVIEFARANAELAKDWDDVKNTMYHGTSEECPAPKRDTAKPDDSRPMEGHCPFGRILYSSWTGCARVERPRGGSVHCIGTCTRYDAGADVEKKDGESDRSP